MNRYQEAWDFVKYRFYDGDETQETDGYTDYKKENFMLMQELVDKATPKYAIKKYFRNTKCIDKYICPNCGSVYFNTMFKYCGKCGQVLSYEERSEDE